MAMLALLSEEDESKLDIFKCVAMAVVHDLAEGSSALSFRVIMCARAHTYMWPCSRSWRHHTERWRQRCRQVQAGIRAHRPRVKRDGHLCLQSPVAQDAIDKFCTQLLPADSKAGQRIKSLWHEYEENTTPEAKFVKDLDKLELGLQAVEYERGT